MKSCPKCQRVFPDDAGFCPADGTALAAASMAPVVRSDLDRLLGARLCGRYEVRRVVADGGMGRVYEGIDKQVNARIAIKVLHDQVANDAVALERFKREYEISALLPHEHIVRVLDFQRDTVFGTWLLVMEFLDGEELRYVLKRDKVLAPERLVRMLAQVAIGLDEAHGRRFIHRDLKPDNLFLCGRREGDIVKILDFGSVKDTSGSPDRKKLTVLGTTIGSPYYMAPEQAQGLESLDPRADVFSLAAVAYECLTGEVPFMGTNGPSILLAILTKDPDPPSRKTRNSKSPVPPSVDAVMEQALAKNPNIRTPSVGALADALGHAFGLEGNHLEWAVTPQHELAGRIAAALPGLRMAQVAVDIVKDPFASAGQSAEARPGGSSGRTPGAAGMPSAIGVATASLGSPGTVSRAAAASAGTPASFGGVATASLGTPSFGGMVPASLGGQGAADRVAASVSAGAISAADRDAAFGSTVREADYQPRGVPPGMPGWLLPVIVGVLALVVGGAVTLVVLGH
ncbi:MAG TPA: serine/threonine-protein kinase [Polyangiaceae bacterium]|nr:serine/threonine-protein kinase [Polyangiaceae bacterium]